MTSRTQLWDPGLGAFVQGPWGENPKPHLPRVSITWRLLWPLEHPTLVGRVPPPTELSAVPPNLPETGQKVKFYWD